MKKYLLLIPLFTSYFCFSQSLNILSNQIDSLNLLIYIIDNEIDTLDQQRLFLKKQVTELKKEYNRMELDKARKEGINVVIGQFGGNLYLTPSVTSELLFRIPRGDTVVVHDWYERPFFKCEYKDAVGYISYAEFVKNEQIQTIIDQDDRKTNSHQNPRLAELTKKYGSQVANRIIKREYWIGMTTAMARESLGRPDKINTSTGSYGSRQQWIYRGRNLYLYFDNGKLSSFQVSN